MLELLFTCPKQGKPFRSAQWSVDSDLETVITPDGRKYLRGLVRVPCPFCDASHAYDPDQLACPLQYPNTDPAPSSHPSDL